MIRCKLYPSIKRVGQARKWFGILACCGFAASISNVTAHGLDNPPQWHGFANQGFSYTTENNFLGESSEGSFKFLEAGLNASWRALNTLQISGQLLYRQTGNAPPDGVEVDYAIADWRVLDTFDYGFGVRAGRIKNPYGFFNETRDVAATRPSILLPESIYIDYLRELMHSSDSVGLYGHSELAGGTATFYAVFGRPILYDTTIPAIIYTQTQGSLEDEAIYSARVGYEDGSGIWRVAVSVADFRADYLAADTEPLFDGKSHITQFLFSAEGYWQNFRLTGEYQRRLIRTENVYFPGLTLKNKGDGYYLQLSYDFNAHFSAYVRWDRIYLNNQDKKGVLYEARTQEPAHFTYAKDITWGARYAINTNWLVGAEYHRVDGTYWLPDLENRSAEAQSSRWDMYLLQVSYRF